jgi:predicted metal-dependent hydrolase
MTASTSRTITVDGVTLSVVVERKHVKNVNARLRASTLSVSAPHQMPKDMLDRVIVDLARKLVRRMHAQRVNEAADPLALARRIAARFPAPAPEVARVTFVTTQQARWGSYSSATQTIRLNATLRAMPQWVLEAVVAHELAHVTHHDHSPAFWALVKRVCPETDRARAFLAGVSWLGQHWEHLPGVEQTLLTGIAACDDEGVPDGDVAQAGTGA